MSPVETNEDRPSPRRAASAIAAIPKAPLWEANAIGPRPRRGRREGGVEANVRCRVEHPEAVGPDEPYAAGATGGQQIGLQARARGSDLGEAAREDDQRADAGFAALTCDAGHGGSRDGDDREVDRARDVADRRERRQPAELCGLRMHDVDRTGEAGGEQVLQHGASDRARPARRADQRDAPRAQDVTHGRDRGDSVAIVEGGDRVGVQRARAARTPARRGPTVTSTGNPESRSTCAMR